MANLYIYIYVYMHAVELKTGPRFGVSSVKNWSKSTVKNWSKFFVVFPQFYSVFWAFLETQIVQQCVKIVFLQYLGDVKNEVFEKKIAFLLSFRKASSFLVGKLRSLSQDTRGVKLKLCKVKLSKEAVASSTPPRRLLVKKLPPLRVLKLPLQKLRRLEALKAQSSRLGSQALKAQ